jgi:serine phosphatase RsbU (regulator of sigma subunit)
MRSAVRALIAVDADPASVLARLDLLFERFEFDQIVTMVYAVADAGKQQLTIANAGHPSPIVIRGDGTIAEVGERDGLLFGAGRYERTAVVVPFHAGDTFLAFTDGLIERRGEDIDISQGRLVDECSALVDGDLTSTLGGVIKRVRDETRDDDVAVVAIRASHEHLH